MAFFSQKKKKKALPLCNAFQSYEQFCKKVVHVHVGFNSNKECIIFPILTHCLCHHDIIITNFFCQDEQKWFSICACLQLKTPSILWKNPEQKWHFVCDIHEAKRFLFFREMAERYFFLRYFFSFLNEWMTFFNAEKCFLPSKEQKIHKANNTPDNDKILCLFSVALPSNIGTM